MNTQAHTGRHMSKKQKCHACLCIRELILVIIVPHEYSSAPIFSLENVTCTYGMCIKHTRANGSIIISFAFAHEALCSVYAHTTVLARVGNTWIIHYNRHIHVQHTIWCEANIKHHII